MPSARLNYERATRTRGAGVVVLAVLMAGPVQGQSAAGDTAVEIPPVPSAESSETSKPAAAVRSHERPVIPESSVAAPPAPPPSQPERLPASKGALPGWVGDAAMVLATVLGPLAATWFALKGQAEADRIRLKARALRIRGAIRREVEANLQTSDAMWDAVGTSMTRDAERLAASRRLSRRPLPVWERDAYGSLLAELPDAVGEAEYGDRVEAMAETAEHYGLLRRMDWSQRHLHELQRPDAGENAEDNVADDDRWLMAWEVYAEARARLVEIGNPLDFAATGGKP